MTITSDAVTPVPTSLQPPATIGMLGGGQLGRYALVAARALGYRTMVLDPDPLAPAGAVADEHLVAPYDDTTALDRLAVGADLVTVEFENPPARALTRLAAAVRVAPSPAALAIAQDRRLEKQFCTESGFPVGPYQVIEPDGAPLGSDLVGPSAGPGPWIMKTARLGYDGRGQRRVGRAADVEAIWAELGGVACVLEQQLDLEAELSVIVARTPDARVATYPVAENVHVDGILDLTVVPARVPADLADRAVGLGMAVADALDYVGVLAVEMFVVDGQLLVNELAPRPHNSGHWSIDAAWTSQFEQQIRAVCGLGLGRTAASVPAAAMANLLGDLWGDRPPDWTLALEHPDAKLHLYGKHEARPGRKMGHLTVSAESADAAEVLVRRLRSACAAEPDAVSRRRMP